MTTGHEGLEQEIQYVTKPFEVKHIRSLFEGTDPLMHEIAFSLIKGDQHEVNRMTRQALDEGFAANTVRDDGLIAGMAIVGIKFRDNIIFVPEVLISARAMKAARSHGLKSARIHVSAKAAKAFGGAALCGQALAESALEKVRVTPAALQTLKNQDADSASWKELWPDPV